MAAEYAASCCSSATAAAARHNEAAAKTAAAAGHRSSKPSSSHDLISYCSDKTSSHAHPKSHHHHPHEYAELVRVKNGESSSKQLPPPDSRHRQQVVAGSEAPLRHYQQHKARHKGMMSMQSQKLRQLSPSANYSPGKNKLGRPPVQIFHPMPPRVNCFSF